MVTNLPSTTTAGQLADTLGEWGSVECVVDSPTHRHADKEKVCLGMALILMHSPEVLSDLKTALAQLDSHAIATQLVEFNEPVSGLSDELEEGGVTLGVCGSDSMRHYVCSNSRVCRRNRIPNKWSRRRQK